MGGQRLKMNFQPVIVLIPSQDMSFKTGNFVRYNGLPLNLVKSIVPKTLCERDRLTT